MPPSSSTVYNTFYFIVLPSIRVNALFHQPILHAERAEVPVFLQALCHGHRQMLGNPPNVDILCPHHNSNWPSHRYTELSCENSTRLPDENLQNYNNGSLLEMLLLL